MRIWKSLEGSLEGTTNLKEVMEPKRVCMSGRVQVPEVPRASKRMVWYTEPDPRIHAHCHVAKRSLNDEQSKSSPGRMAPSHKILHSAFPDQLKDSSNA